MLDLRCDGGNRRCSFIPRLTFRITKMFRVFQVLWSGDYAWRKQSLSPRGNADEENPHLKLN
jgi:hypothetical protein